MILKQTLRAFNKSLIILSYKVKLSLYHHINEDKFIFRGKNSLYLHTNEESKEYKTAAEGKATIEAEYYI